MDSTDADSRQPGDENSRYVVWRCPVDFSDVDTDEISSRTVLFSVKRGTPLPSLQRIVDTFSLVGIVQSGVIDKGSTCYLTFESCLMALNILRQGMKEDDGTQVSFFSAKADLLQVRVNWCPPLM